MHRLRNRLIAVSLVATLVPLVATVWITATLLDRSLGYATTDELDALSSTLEETVRRFYRRERRSLRDDARTGRVAPVRHTVTERAAWGEPIVAFWQSGDDERFLLSGPGGDHLDYLWRVEDGVEHYRRDLGGLRLQVLSARLGEARAVVGSREALDLRRGFTMTLLLLVALVWLGSLAPLFLLATRVTRPIQQLTDGLTDFAGGNWDRRLPPGHDDEVGRAVAAFNHMAGELRRQRDRLVTLAQMTSWQALARKTAHELKNSLTPIRLTVEEMLARQPPSDREFMEEAVRIVVSEIDTLERRVSAFSELAREPESTPQDLDVEGLVAERIALLRSAHPDTGYEVRAERGHLTAYAGADLVKGILTNLLENAAEAAGAGGQVLVVTRPTAREVEIEVHDSGPGLSAEARRTLFEPTITFKHRGMGLGLSIARKHALVSGGDIALVDGELGGAGFRITLPTARESEAPS